MTAKLSALPALLIIAMVAATAIGAIPEIRSHDQILWVAVAPNIDAAEKGATAPSGVGVRILLLGDTIIHRPCGDGSDVVSARLAKLADVDGTVVGAAISEESDSQTGNRRLALTLVAPGKSILAYNHATMPVVPIDGAIFGPARNRNPLRIVDIDGFAVGIAAIGDADLAIPELADRGASLILLAGAPIGREQVERFATLARLHRAGLLIAGRCTMTPSCVSAAAVDANGDVDWMGDNRHAFIRRPASSPPSAMGLPRSVPQPTLYRYSMSLAELGRAVFFDKEVSESRAIACASCHVPKLGFSDGRSVSSGIRGRSTGRNTISLLNVAFRPVLRWDGYATSLEQFVAYPISADDEMASHRLDGVVERVRNSASYRARFAELFGTHQIRFDMIAKALAAYMRTLVSGDSSFDRATVGGRQEAMSESAWRGYDLFNGRAGCGSCHTYSKESPFFTDFKVHNTGLGWNAARSRYSDTGAGATSTSADWGSFRTPTLRDVARTGPYMHDGSIRSLRGVIDYFDRGGGDGPKRDPKLRPLNLSERDKRDLEAFLTALTGGTSFDEHGRRREREFAANH